MFLIPHIFPVSYTHLDVYKRQDISCSVGVTFVETPRVIFDEISVSYTHLDVYKRQAYLLAKFKNEGVEIVKEPGEDVYKRQPKFMVSIQHIY